jgi:23S rRNA (adenine2503-C2)-methyltransferase
MACGFCYTGRQKLKRRLTTAEIVGQFYRVRRDLAESDQRITNVVFMGMGEPLDNPDAVFKFVEIIHSPWGFGFSRRKITVSTSGLVPQIPLVTEAGVRLAVSLNGTTNEIRSQVMPINKKYPMEQLLDACRDYTNQTGDRVTFEYVLLKGVTDSMEDARRLIKIARSVPCKVNLIPFNEHPGSGYYRPSDDVVYQFQHELFRKGIHVLLRRTMGRDIYAACGQLTSHYKGRPETMEIATVPQ